jgi:tetratricopeptide (TPR) repeat protein
VSSTEPEVSGGGSIAAAPATVAVGAVLGGRYRLEAVAGRGGMATVFRALDLRHGRAVAVKVLDAARLSTVDAARFEGEIDVLARLQHPHVLPLLDSGTIDGARYLVTPFIAGESLARTLARETRLPLTDAVRLARQVASALAHAHALEVIHRDVTPGNILLSNGLAVVSDFGIARLAEPAAGVITNTGITIGTPAYMSPEQAAGDSALDARSDVYSLGCVLYTMLTGAPPFAELPVQQSLTKRMLQPPPPPSAVRPDIPGLLDAVMLRVLAPLAEDRYDSAMHFDAALALVEAELVSAARPHTTLTRALVATPASTPLPTRIDVPSWRSWWIAGACVTLAAIGALIVRARGADASVDMQVIGVTSGGADSAAVALRDAIGRWRDVSVREIADVPFSPDAERLAHAPESARIGAMAWTRVVRTAEGRSAVQVDAARFDGERVIVARGVVPLVAMSLRDATRLALDSALGVVVPVGDRGASSLAAQRAYATGRRAMQRWETDSAVSALRRAVAADSGWAGAQLALTQVLVWLGDSTRAEARDAAERMAPLVTGLGSRSVSAGQAIVAMGRGDYPQACNQYRALVNADSSDASAWLGLGLCQQRDSLVVVNRSSPSGFAFRSSHWGAIRAMERALTLDPDAGRVFGFNWLTRKLLPLNITALRQGVAESTEPFSAFPTDQADTLAFVPWRMSDLFGRPRLLSEDVSRAYGNNRRRALSIMTMVQRLRPQSPEANESLALALESVGEIDEIPTRANAIAIDSVVRAATVLSTSSAQRLRVATLKVRLALRRGQFAEARRLADSVLATPAPAKETAAGIRMRSALYALTGRVHEAAQGVALEAASANPGSDAAPGSLRRSAALLLAYSAFGIKDSIESTYRRTEVELKRWLPPAMQSNWRDMTLAQPALLAADALGGLPPWAGALSRSRMGRLIAAADVGDRNEGATVMKEISSRRGSFRPADVTLDAVLIESRALLKLGQADAARGMIESALDALPARDGFLFDVPTSASLVALIRLRGELEPESSTAKRWRAAADTLTGTVSAR